MASISRAKSSRPMKYRTGFDLSTELLFHFLRQFSDVHVEGGIQVRLRAHFPRSQFEIASVTGLRKQLRLYSFRNVRDRAVDRAPVGSGSTHPASAQFVFRFQYDVARIAF